jgi:hypothetical protein
MENANVSQIFNAYDRRPTEEEIRLGFHRAFVGGMWDELRRFQTSAIGSTRAIKKCSASNRLI